MHRYGLLLPLCGLTFLLAAGAARGDVIIATNGERFVGKVVEEAPESVVFESEVGGRLTIARSRIRELQRTAGGAATTTAVATTRAATTTAVATVAATAPSRPAGVGQDGFDWLELDSGEWLKGRLVYVQKKRVELDSDKLDRQKFDLKDVRAIYPAHPMNVKFEDLPPVFAPVKVQNGIVTVDSPEPMRRSVDDLTGITPGGKRERDYWSGDFSLGVDLESGNTRQLNASADFSLSRRTPDTRFDLEYIGNYSVVNDIQNAQDQRLTATYDIFLDHGFFIRPVSAEYYRDPLANIENRITLGVGLGYSIFDREDLDWFVAAGPSYQKTWFVDVPAGENDTAASPGLLLQTKFKKELTNKIDLIFEYGGIFTTPESGSYSHHIDTTFKFELTKSFDLNISFIWDRINNPQTQSNGSVPKKDDYRMTVGVGWTF